MARGLHAPPAADSNPLQASCQRPPPPPQGFIGRGGRGGRDALEGEGPQRRPQKRLDGRLEEVAEAVGGGYCRLQMPLRPALGVRGTGDSG